MTSNHALDDHAVQSILNEMLKQESENIVSSQLAIAYCTEMLLKIDSARSDILTFEETWRKISERVDDFLEMQYAKKALTINDCVLMYVKHRGNRARTDWYLDVPKSERKSELVSLIQIVPQLPTAPLPNLDPYHRALMVYLFATKKNIVEKTTLLTSAQLT